MQTNTNFKIETQRLLLKPVSENDFEPLHKILTNSFVRKYLCDDKVFSQQQTAEMLVENTKLFAEEKFGLWFVEKKNTREIIGFVGLWYFFAEKQPQLMYALLPQGTKQGYGFEAATAIVDYGFHQLGYQYLLASCDRPNLDSQKLAQRLGMKKVKEEKDTLFFWIDNN